MPHEHIREKTARRDFLKGSAAAAALASAALPLTDLAPARAAPGVPNQPLVGIQVGAVSFADEGVDQVLDIIQERGQANAIFLATFTYGRGIAGRQVPGQLLPDHGKQEYDDKTFHGGNYATPHRRFYEKTVLKDTRAPDFGDLDILQAVLPRAKQRGIKVYCWYEDVWRRDIPNVEQLQEVDLSGRKAATLCPLNPDLRNFLIGLTEDYCTSYDIDGVMWGSERQGPLHTAIGASHGGRPDPSRVTCFCEHHQKAARERGIDVKRAMEGYQKLARFVRGSLAKERPADGYFVTFWRLLLEYPELLAWEKLWTDGKHAIYGEIFRTARAARPTAQVGFHIWHANSFTPFFRAEQDYVALARTADFFKIVAYNNCAGPRYVQAINNIGSTIFADVPKDELLQLHNHFLNYGDEKPYVQLPAAGLSADYVARETRRALEGVRGTPCRIYPGIDIDIPTGTDQKKTTPADVHEATAAALKAGAHGVIFSRKYSEMKLANLAAGGRAVTESGR
ncbi:MAG TPA: twin-arginine translocation signal domain-containing protein [Tepidisphaeraceae bacterium]|jgi:hypothetical protein